MVSEIWTNRHTYTERLTDAASTMATLANWSAEMDDKLIKLWEEYPCLFNVHSHSAKTRSSADAEGPREAPQIRNIALKKA